MSPLKPNPYLAKLLVCADAVLAVELINTSAGSCSLLLSCVERMALGANLHVDVFLCRTCYELVAAVADNLCLIISWMDSFLHDFHLSIFLLWFPTTRTNVPKFSAAQCAALCLPCSNSTIHSLHSIAQKALYCKGFFRFPGRKRQKNTAVLNPHFFHHIHKFSVVLRSGKQV